MANWQSKLLNLENIDENFVVISYCLIDKGGLFDCCDDCGICCYGCWCTGCLYAENATRIDGSDYTEAYEIYCSPRWGFSSPKIIDNRRALRDKYGLAEEPCDDSLVILCCAPCSVCQAARELKIRNNIQGEFFSLYLLKAFSYFYQLMRRFSYMGTSKKYFYKTFI
jgi:Cys-rich protein (TIGR01571 family)